jgi:uncharacterized protein
MSKLLSTRCTAFAGTLRIASGALIDVALAIRSVAPEMQTQVITFDDSSGVVIELDLRGSTAEVITRLTERGDLEELVDATRSGGGDASRRSRGRPKLGVIAREVTLLPRHWEWLSRQPGGASQVLRRLVDEARRKDAGQTDRKAAHERTYRFLAAIAGDLPGYEEAIRALFADLEDAFAERMAAWPADVRDHALVLARSDFTGETS